MKFRFAIFVLGFSSLFAVSGMSAATSAESVISHDIPGFASNAADLLTDFSSVFVPSGHRLHVLADGGFDLMKKEEYAKAKMKAKEFVSSVMSRSGVSLKKNHVSEVVDFLSEMPPAQGLSVAMEIRPKNVARVETLCRIGMSINDSDALLVSGMFDDVSHVDVMRRRATEMGISPQLIHEYFLVHELGHCVTGMSRFGLDSPFKNRTSATEQLSTLRREMFADAIAGLYWVRGGKDLSVFDFVVEGRVLEFGEYKSLDHMTAPVIVLLLDKYGNESGRNVLLGKSSRQLLELAARLTDASMPSKKDIFRTMEKSFPGYYEKAVKQGLIDDDFDEIKLALNTPPQNRGFVAGVSSLVVKGSDASLVFGARKRFSAYVKQNLPPFTRVKVSYPNPNISGLSEKGLNPHSTLR